MVSEIPERIPYLQAMAVLRASDVVLVMGSWDHYYHASKLYPAIVSGKPILALCHRDTSIVLILEEGRAAARFWTTDLTAEYVRLNADYHT